MYCLKKNSEEFLLAIKKHQHLKAMQNIGSAKDGYGDTTGI
jgi:hypothetical protein